MLEFMVQMCCLLTLLQTPLTTSRLDTNSLEKKNKIIVNRSKSYTKVDVWLLHSEKSREINDYKSEREGTTLGQVPIVPHSYEERSVADMLTRRVRVLCWIMTFPEKHKTQAEHIKATWGKRCNKLLFMSSVDDPSLPAVNLQASSDYDLWGKTKAAFRYVYEHHRRDADWFLKADDDTYVIMENLRYLLAEHNPEDLSYFGCHFKSLPGYKADDWTKGYMSGGAGYVLSRAALDRFVNKGLTSPHLCRVKVDNPYTEDIEMGICLDRIGVKVMDSRDSLRRQRFFPFQPLAHTSPKFLERNHWYRRYLYYPGDCDLDCCSDHTVSFHYIGNHSLYSTEYLIYHLRPYGISYGQESADDSTRDNQVTESGIGKDEALLKSNEAL